MTEADFGFLKFAPLNFFYLYQLGEGGQKCHVIYGWFLGVIAKKIKNKRKRPISKEQNCRHLFGYEDPTLLGIFNLSKADVFFC